MLIVLGLCSWAVAVYSTRVALFGNPLQRLVAHTPPEAFQLAHEQVEAGRLQPGTPEAHLLQRFSRLTLVEIGVFILELAVLVYLLFVSSPVNRVFWLALVLFGKDLLALGLSVVMARRQEEPATVFDYLHRLPRWLVRLDRLSALLSGLGFAALFFMTTGIAK